MKCYMTHFTTSLRLSQTIILFPILFARKICLHISYTESSSIAMEFMLSRSKRTGRNYISRFVRHLFNGRKMKAPSCKLTVETKTHVGSSLWVASSITVTKFSSKSFINIRYVENAVKPASLPGTQRSSPKCIDGKPLRNVFPSVKNCLFGLRFLSIWLLHRRQNVTTQAHCWRESIFQTPKRSRFSLIYVIQTIFFVCSHIVSRRKYI